MKTNELIIFETELEQHMDVVYRFAYYNLCHQRDEAEDLVQETYVRAWTAIGQFQKGSSARAWLIQILKNTYFTRYQKRKRAGKSVDYEENVVQQAKNDPENAPSERSSNFDHLSDDPLYNPFGDEEIGRAHV